MGSTRPNENVTVAYDLLAAGPAASASEFSVSLSLQRAGVGRELLLGSPEESRLEYGSLGLTFGTRLRGENHSSVYLEIDFPDAAIVIRPGADGDGFITNLLPGEVNSAVSFAAGLDSEAGFYFAGSSGLEIVLPLHSPTGPVELLNASLSIKPAEGGLATEIGLSAKGLLGPITAIVENIGLRAAIAFPAQGGNLGPADLTLRFKPPRGLGLVVDAGPITGGGFIAFDPEAGRYSGVLQLELYGIGVTAVGVLDTRDTEGHSLPPPGFSFLLLISAEFVGLQLGFGFTLTGVGGLIGINRAMATEALRGGVHDGSLDHVMFPSDPLRNMPQIISELRTFFPPADGRFIFGPMVRVGWGTPSLFEGEIGVLLEVPSPVVVALIGQLNVALPTEDADIVALHVSILGIIDFGEKLLSIDASLYDSRIALFSVYGDMAMRLGWGDRPTFALAIGGLHPGFRPPPRFPSLRRVTVSLGLGDNPRIGFQAYMALTSNSIQFGAAAEIYAAVGSLNIYGWLRFDALVVFSPFHFEFEFSVGFALRWDEDAIAGISISGLIAGPSPLRIRGEACVSTLFVDIRIGFDVSIGSQEDVPLPAKNPWEPLKVALEDHRNWSAALAEDVRPGITYREPTDGTPLLVHPMGSVTVRQRVVPPTASSKNLANSRLSVQPSSN